MSLKMTIIIIALIIGAAFLGSFLGTLGHDNKKPMFGNSLPPPTHNPATTGQAPSFPSFQYSNATH